MFEEKRPNHYRLLTTISVAPLLLMGCDDPNSNQPQEPSHEGKSCQTADECNSGFTCYQQACRKVCQNDNDCDGAKKCVSSVCLELTVSECQTADDCKNPNNVCQTSANPSCKGGKCIYQPMDAGFGCDDGNRCTDHDVCDGAGNCKGVEIVCNDPPANTCSDDNTKYISYAPIGSCTPTNSDEKLCDYAVTEENVKDCMAEKLGKQALGNACKGPDDCASGFCVDGVCCDTQCDRQDICSIDDNNYAHYYYYSCSQEDKIGTCLRVNEDCHLGCNESSTNCQDKCSDNSECDEGYFCNNNGDCVAKLENGATCDKSQLNNQNNNVNDICANNICADGYCCQNQCYNIYSCKDTCNFEITVQSCANGSCLPIGTEYTAIDDGKVCNDGFAVAPSEFNYCTKKIVNSSECKGKTYFYGCGSNNTCSEYAADYTEHEASKDHYFTSTDSLDEAFGSYKQICGDNAQSALSYYCGSNYKTDVCSYGCRDGKCLPKDNDSSCDPTECQSRGSTWYCSNGVCCNQGKCPG